MSGVPAGKWYTLSAARAGLLSAVSTDYVVSRLRTKFCKRAFSYASPVAWNSLPVHVREEMDFHRFKGLLRYTL